MGQILGGPKPSGPDPELARLRLEEERKAQEEKAAAEAKKKEEQAAFQRRLRGSRSLLSAAGGELGFKTSLGG